MVKETSLQWTDISVEILVVDSWLYALSPSSLRTQTYFRLSLVPPKITTLFSAEPVKPVKYVAGTSEIRLRSQATPHPTKPEMSVIFSPQPTTSYYSLCLQLGWGLEMTDNRHYPWTGKHEWVSVRVRKWSQDRKWSPDYTANYPQIVLQMIPGRKSGNGP